MTYSSPQAYLLIGKETTWGTAVTADKACGLIVTDVSPSIDREIIESQGISSIETQKITTGMVDASLSLEGDYQNARLFDFIIGESTHVETTGDIKHTFTVDNSPKSFTGEKGNVSAADTEFIIDGMKAESAELSIELNSNLKLSAEFKGRLPTNGTTGKTAVLSTLPVFPHSLVTVTINDVIATECQKASISFNKVIEKTGGTNSNLPQQSEVTELKIEWSAELGFDDTTYHQLAMGGVTLTATGDPTEFDFEMAADNEVVLGSGQRNITCALENCQTKSFVENTSVGGLTFVTISGSGTLKTLTSVDNIASADWF